MDRRHHGTTGLPFSKVRSQILLHTHSAPSSAFQKQDVSESSDDENTLPVVGKKRTRLRKAPTLERPNASLLQKPLIPTPLLHNLIDIGSSRSPPPLSSSASSDHAPSDRASSDRVMSPSSLEQRSEGPSAMSMRSTDSEVDSRSVVSVDGVSYHIIIPRPSTSPTLKYTDL